MTVLPSAVADFQFSLNNFKADQIQIMAASTDSIEKTKKLAADLGISYPMAYGLDLESSSSMTGAFYEKDRKFLHPANILLRPDKTIGATTYSSGAIGRFVAQDVLRLVRFWKDQEKR